MKKVKKETIAFQNHPILSTIHFVVQIHIQITRIFSKYIHILANNRNFSWKKAKYINARYPFERSLIATRTYFTLFDDPKTSNFLRNGNEGRKKKRRKMYARYTTIEGYLSICYVCRSIATLRAQYKQRKGDKNHSLSRFLRSVYVPLLRPLSFRLVIRRRKK